MNSFYHNIKPYVEREIDTYKVEMKNGNLETAFKHLENAHVLGQYAMTLHLKVHCLMLIWGIKQRDLKEVGGQLLRIPGTILFTWLNRLPDGNTGGANVPPLLKMEIPVELKKVIDEARLKKSNE